MVLFNGFDGFISSGLNVSQQEILIFAPLASKVPGELDARRVWLAWIFFEAQNPLMFMRRPAFKISATHFPARRAAWVQCCRKVFILLPILLGFGAGAGESQSPNYFPRSWKTEDGLPDNAVTAVVQTHDGYLWAGTYGGLARFDGAHFTVFNSASTPALQSDRVTSLFEDAKGTLWIGHERGDLTCYHDGQFEAQTVHETGARRKITAIGADQDGDIWMLNEEGTLVRAGDGAACALPNNDGVAQLAQDGRGRLWVASGGQLAVEQNGKLTISASTNNSVGISGYVLGICPSHDGGLWILTAGQVSKWDGHAVTESRIANSSNAAAVAMVETKSGALAIGTSSDGLYLVLSNRAILHFNHASGFPSDWIRSLCEDWEGTLWVGAGSEGLIALRPGKIETLDPPDRWQGCVPLSVCPATDGALWVGTEGAGLYRFLDGKWEHFTENTGLANLFVWCVGEDSEGRVWAGTWGGGMFRQQGSQFIVPPGLESTKVPMPAILQAGDGVTWIGTASGLIRYQAGAVKWFGEQDGLKVPDVRYIVNDPDGTVWFGMLGGGLGRLKNGRLDQFLKSDGLSSDYVQCLHPGAKGALWIGSYGSGLDRLKNGHLAKITTTEGLPNNFICAMEEDGHGNFWISSHGGIFRVSEQALNDCADGKSATVSCLVYGKGDGLPSLQCSGGLQPASCKLADGRICFTTGKGLVILNPADTKVNRLAPPVLIEDVVAGGHTLVQRPDAKSPLKIPPGLQRFEFHFTGLSFIAPEKMQFQYRLEGWEKDWQNAASDKRVAPYSYIPPGSYTFHVRAGNSDGVWNDAGATVALVVLPQFWQTWWARALAVMAAVAAVTEIVVFITRRRMRRKLEIVQRQQAVEHERTRIAKDIHDHLGANLTRISLLSQSAHGELENHSQAAAQLDRIYNTTRELTRSMDEIVWAVDPQHDTLDSLASYLGNFAQEYLASLNIRCRLDVPLHLPQWPITAEMRHNVFLAFKEALHNVVKHSDAKEVSIFLATDNYGFQLAVRDKGKGFDPDNVTPRPGRGNGLKNMRQRLHEIGGTCEIKSAPGQGAEIIFSLSVPARARKQSQKINRVVN
jgi:signal transduction histidine kinase/ligand-binding sensor domain-containing protein